MPLTFWGVYSAARLRFKIEDIRKESREYQDQIFLAFFVLEDKIVTKFL